MYEALTPVSEMLSRNLDMLCHQPLLVCGLLEDDLPGLLAAHGPAPVCLPPTFAIFSG
ncbi:hypothetical protein MBH78_09840 [Oceanimonas sp. NS1]|nr:hypothetical protein [Oceanimonas sp. NS1]